VRGAEGLVKAELYLFGTTSLDPLLDSEDRQIMSIRAELKAGGRHVPLGLGVVAPVGHIERGQRDCYGQARDIVSLAVGPAGRVIDCGYFATSTLDLILSSLERPKAGIALTATLNTHAHERPFQGNTTAQMSLLRHNACEGPWPLDPIAAGRTLVVLSGGGFGPL
jgi:hypothetical protein